MQFLRRVLRVRDGGGKRKKRDEPGKCKRTNGKRWTSETVTERTGPLKNRNALEDGRSAMRTRHHRCTCYLSLDPPVALKLASLRRCADESVPRSVPRSVRRFFVAAAGALLSLIATNIDNKRSRCARTLTALFELIFLAASSLENWLLRFVSPQDERVGDATYISFIGDAKCPRFRGIIVAEASRG